MALGFFRMPQLSAGGGLLLTHTRFHAASLALIAWTWAILPPVHAAEVGMVFRSGLAQTSLVELYTSEGCSSCPPAEAWLNRLGSRPGLWSEFVPVAMHVNYWDHLGWRDPWASREFTDRQRAYARAWQNDSVYTPALVLNGQEWRAWSGHKEIPRSTANPGVLTARAIDGTRWQIEFAPSAAAQKMEASVALLTRGVASDVRAGENRGRRLQHDFVVAALVRVPLKKVGNIFQGEATLAPDGIPQGGTFALAVWVTVPGQLTPLQALGGDLPPPVR